MYIHEAPREAAYTPSAGAWRVHQRALRDPGEQIDRGSAGLAAPHVSHDFSKVRVHSNEDADLAAKAMAARAYTWGNHIFFQRGEYERRGDLLTHEVGHVVEQLGKEPTVMRAARAPTPATYIICYGSGWVNPEMAHQDHDVGKQFKLAADAKRREIVARLGTAARMSTIVFEYTPTEAELKAALNRPYAQPVKEVHIFSHGWNEGINLGGPGAGPGKPATESLQDVQERRLQPGDLANYHVHWAAEPEVVLYGCNTGNPAGSVPFAQSMSDEFGVPVKGSTVGTHFVSGGQFGLREVPDRPGQVKEFMPSPSLVGTHTAEVERLTNLIIAKLTMKGGLLTVMKSRRDASALRAQMERHLTWLQQVLGDTRLAIPDRTVVQAKVAALVKRADDALAAP
jgi:Domain of unknown function (DUF4157)/Domain of unknown function (DUF4347)